jgi:hypothetical protein
MDDILAWTTIVRDMLCTGTPAYAIKVGKADTVCMT